MSRLSRLSMGGRRGHTLTRTESVAVTGEDGGAVLACATAAGGEVVVITQHRFVVLGEAASVLTSAPWHLVEGGAWESDVDTLVVSWVDGSPVARWPIPEPGRLPEAFRERVQASIVLTEHLDLGPRRRVRVVLRKDLRTGQLLDQILLGRGVSLDDPGVREAAEATRLAMWEHVGQD